MSAPLPPAPSPPPRTGTRGLLREMRQVRPAPPGRTAFAARAALAMGIPVLAGWLAGDTTAGLMATLGAFTALYCGDRPYAARAIALAVIALAFAGAVVFGLWLEPHGWAVLPALVLVAMLATWLCNAMRVGPPGAYLFVLACASGTAMPAGHLPAWHAGLLVLAGGAVAWALHTAGALWQLRGPERRAVAAAARAVAAGIDPHGGEDPPARRRAAQALHDSWQMLVGFQPIPARRDGELARLRALNRQLHLIFAANLDPSLPPQRRSALQRRAGALALEAQRPAIRRPPALPRDAIPHGYPRSWTLLREGLAPGSNSLRVVLRVGLACLLAGTVAATLEVERAYWAMAAALLMLHQGLSWTRTVQRSVERTAGTWAGLLLAGAVLWLHPSGPWLALVVMGLQFAIEIVVVRNYGLAVVFITAAALTIASGGRPVDDLGGLLLARGVDTLVGCLCALAAFRLLPPRAGAASVAGDIGQCLLGIRTVVLHLARGEVASPAARVARRDLQHRSFLLEQTLDQALAGSPEERRTASEHWPAVATCQRLVYRVLAACWDAEREPPAAHGGDGPTHEEAGERTAAPALQAGDEAVLSHALGTLARAWLSLQPPPPLPPLLPALVAEELGDLQRFLRRRLGTGT